MAVEKLRSRLLSLFIVFFLFVIYIYIFFRFPLVELRETLTDRGLVHVYGWFFSCLFQEEDAVLAEMEFTGQAFEEMQEQNVRLLQQLREKDDANLKLMSEVMRQTFFPSEL